MSYYLFYEDDYKVNKVLNCYNWKEVYKDKYKTIVYSPVKLCSNEDITGLYSLELVESYIGDTLDDVFLIFPQLDSYNINRFGNKKSIIDRRNYEG